MKTLKDHQDTMVSMLASGTAIPTSAIRLAHALHDVLAHLNNANAAPVAHTERRIDATTPGLNDAMLAEAIKTCSGKIMSDVQKQSEDFAARFSEKRNTQSLESLLKQRDNTIRQLKGRVADLVAESSAYQSKVVALQDLLADARGGVEPEQAGCRKEDTEVAEDGWIEWCGGECPCDDRAVVEVRLRSGNERMARGALSWEWKHHNNICDIIAYRVEKS